jgi:uncharacterized DUF497 family protein
MPSGRLCFSGPRSSNGILARLPPISANTASTSRTRRQCFYDEEAITIPDEGWDEEDRFVTLDMDALGRVLVVVYTWHEDRPRLISARKATSRERRQYQVAR